MNMYFFKKAFLIIIFLNCLYTKRAFPQTKIIDSLKKILPLLKDTARIDCLNELGFELSNRYWSNSKYQQTDTALFYTLQAQNESQHLHYLPGIGKAFQNMGMIEEEHNNFKSSEFYTQKALLILQKENMQAEFHRGRINLGWCLYHRGLFQQSIIIYKAELPYYAAVKDTEHLAMIYRMMARAYDIQGSSENAFTYFQKDFMIRKKPKDVFGNVVTPSAKALFYLTAGDTATAILYYRQAAASSINQHVILEAYHQTMAIVYELQKKYDSSLMEIQKNIVLIQSSKSDSLYRKAALMISYSDLIDVFYSLKKFDSVIVYGKLVQTFFKQGEDVTSLMAVLKTVASACNAKKENFNALFYINQLLTYSQSTGAKRFERDGYRLLWHIYSEQHKTNLANTYHLKYVVLNDSLENDKYISQAAAWQAINEININEVKYENRLKLNNERNVAKVKSINNEKKTQLYIFLAAIALFSSFTVLIVRNSKLKRKKEQLQLMIAKANITLEKQKREQEVAQLNQQKTELELQALRAQMNPHFIFNCLNSINRFIINNDAEKAADYLTKFAKLIRIVLEQSGQSFVLLEDEIFCLKLYMDLEALRFENPFQYKINLNGIDASLIMIPTLIIQPFIENAIWHGLHLKQNGIGEININMHVYESILQCAICDNGAGIHHSNKNQNTKKSLGMQLTQQRLQLVNNSNDVKIKIEQLKDEHGQIAGTCVYINIPLKLV
jgi:sensor histidine kinase YesM